VAHAAPVTPTVKPRLRGVFHELGFYVAVALAVPVTLTAEPGRARLSALVFALCLAACFGASALYHRPTWGPVVRARLARVDHAGIYLLIAGTYTPVGLLTLHGVLQTVVLAIVWSGAAAAILLKLVWVHAPKWLSAVIAIALGWVGVAAIPEIVRADGVTPVALIAAGGLAYTCGGIVYARRRPDPMPTVFGYHELFHALTLVGLALQYVAIAFFVV
jgi:hemolysin III